MSAKRDEGRQRRANQNRAAREALEARRAAAARAAEPVEQPAKGRGRTRAQGGAVAPPVRRSGSGRSASAASARAAPASDADEAPAAGLWARSAQLPGGRQMLGGFALSLVSGALALLTPLYKEHANDRNTQSLLQLAGAQGLVLVGLPVLITAAPLLFMNHPRRRVAWNGAAVMMGLWILLVAAIGIFYLPVTGLVAYGAVKASRAAGPSGGGLLSRLGRRGGAPVEPPDAIDDADDGRGSSGPSEKRSAD